MKTNIKPQKTFYLSEKQLDKIIAEQKKKSSDIAKPFTVAIISEHLSLSKEEICEIAQDIERWEGFLNEKIIKINEIAELIYKKNGIRFEKIKPKKTKNKKNKDRKKKFYMLESEVEKIKKELSKEVTENTFLLVIATIADTLNLSEEKICLCAKAISEADLKNNSTIMKTNTLSNMIKIETQIHWGKLPVPYQIFPNTILKERNI